MANTFWHDWGHFALIYLFKKLHHRKYCENRFIPCRFSSLKIPGLISANTKKLYKNYLRLKTRVLMRVFKANWNLGILINRTLCVCTKYVVYTSRELLNKLPTNFMSNVDSYKFTIQFFCFPFSSIHQWFYQPLHQISQGHYVNTHCSV